MNRRREDIRSRWGSRRSRDRRPFGGADDVDVEEVSSEESVEEGDGVEEGAGLASASIDIGDSRSGESGARQDADGPAEERGEVAPVEEEYRTIEEAVEADATARALEGAGRLALAYAARRPTIYGPVYAGAELTRRIIASREIDGSYYFRVAYQPSEGFTGEPGIEEIFVEKSGAISLRQIVRAPMPRWGPAAAPMEAPRPLRPERAARPEPVAEAPRAEAPPAAPLGNRPELRQINTAIEYRSPWQVGLFTLLFSYLNVVIWFGVTWSEIKREGGGRRMSSVWHGLATLVPLYGWNRGWSHYAAINSLMERARRPGRISRPGIALAGMASAQAVAWSMFFLPWTWQSGLVVWVTVASLNGLVMILAQGALNDYREGR